MVVLVTAPAASASSRRGTRLDRLAGSHNHRATWCPSTRASTATEAGPALGGSSSGSSGGMTPSTGGAPGSAVAAVIRVQVNHDAASRQYRFGAAVHEQSGMPALQKRAALRTKRSGVPGLSAPFRRRIRSLVCLFRCGVTSMGRTSSFTRPTRTRPVPALPSESSSSGVI